MTLDQFRRALVCAFGKGWLMPASEALGIHHSKLQRMASGKERRYTEVDEKVRRFMRLRRGEINALLREMGDEA